MSSTPGSDPEAVLAQLLDELVASYAPRFCDRTPVDLVSAEDCRRRLNTCLRRHRTLFQEKQLRLSWPEVRDRLEQGQLARSRSSANLIEEVVLVSACWLRNVKARNEFLHRYSTLYEERTQQMPAVTDLQGTPQSYPAPDLWAFCFEELEGRSVPRFTLYAGELPLARYLKNAVKFAWLTWCREISHPPGQESDNSCPTVWKPPAPVPAYLLENWLPAEDREEWARLARSALADVIGALNSEERMMLLLITLAEWKQRNLIPLLTRQTVGPPFGTVSEPTASKRWSALRQRLPLLVDEAVNRRRPDAKLDGQWLEVSEREAAETVVILCALALAEQCFGRRES